MQNTLLTAGIACIVGAIVGGGLKAFGIELPLLSSISRQLILAFVGTIFLIGSAFAAPQGSQPGAADAAVLDSAQGGAVTPPPPSGLDEAGRESLANELQANESQIASINDSLGKSVANEATLKELMAQQRVNLDRQQGALDRGEGSEAERQEATRVMAEAREVIVKTQGALARADAADTAAREKIQVLEARDGQIREHLTTGR